MKKLLSPAHLALSYQLKDTVPCLPLSSESAYCTVQCKCFFFESRKVHWRIEFSFCKKANKKTIYLFIFQIEICFNQMTKQCWKDEIKIIQQKRLNSDAFNQKYNFGKTHENIHFIWNTGPLPSYCLKRLRQLYLDVSFSQETIQVDFCWKLQQPQGRH